MFMTHRTYDDKGEPLSIYMRKEVRDFLEEIAKSEERSMSFVVNRMLMNLKQKDLENKANGTGTTGVVKKIGTEDDKNNTETDNIVKEVVENE